MPKIGRWVYGLGPTVQRVDSSACGATPVVPSNTNKLPNGVALGLYVGVAGDVRVLLEDDAAPVTFKGLAAGMIHPLRAIQVLSTGTTATDILAVY